MIKILEWKANVCVHSCHYVHHPEREPSLSGERNQNLTFLFVLKFYLTGETFTVYN